MRALLLAFVFCTHLTADALACRFIPPLAGPLDSLLPSASLSAADRKTVVALRERITQLDAAGDKEGARRVEEQAMKLLGYEKVWLRCGPGTFMWTKLDPPDPKAGH
jgi:hypothetical protein